MTALLGAPAHAVTLMPYGAAAGDTAMAKADDTYVNVSFAGLGPGGSTPVLNFYDYAFTGIFVNNNGSLSFLQGVSSFTSSPFPQPFDLVTPFSGDVDTRGTGGGTVWYRLEQDSANLAQISSLITSQVPTAAGFQATFAFIATWDHVGYYSQKVDKLNTFQAVIASNGSQTYTLFLYADNGINWLIGGATGTGYPLMGFNAGDNVRSYSHPLSSTANIATLPTLTNTTPGIPGLFIYRTDGPTITATATAPVTGTATASSGVASWIPGTGTWTGDATTWKNGFNAIWNAPARVVKPEVGNSASIVTNNLQLNSSGFTFKFLQGIQFNQLRFATPSDKVTFDGCVLLANASDAITQGDIWLTNGTVLVARAAGAVNGGSLHLTVPTQVAVFSANAMTDQTALVFDGNTLGNSGCKLDLRGFNATVGTINSVTSSAGVIFNSGTTMAAVNVAGAASSDFKGQIMNGTGPTALTKSGTGTLTLYASNPYSGPTAVRGGTLAVSGGALTGTSSVEVQNGTLALTGTTLNAPMAVGTSLGAATLNIATTTLTTSSFSAGQTAGTTGTIALTSGTWNSPAGVTLANFGTASLTVTGGSLTTSSIILGHDGGTASVALNGGVVTTGEIARWSVPSGITFNGGILRAAGDTSVLLNGFTSGSAVIQAGGLTIDTQGFTVATPAELTGSGPLTKTGTGTLSLNGISTYTGRTTVSAGTLSLATPCLADTSSVSVASGAVLNLAFTGTDTVADLTLAGVTYTSGTWGALGSGAQHETALITGPGRLLLSEFGQWLTANGLPGSTATGDDDHDGIPNLLEYFNGSHPAQRSTPTHLLTKGQNLLTFSFDRRKNLTGVTYAVEWSDDLVTWRAENISVPAVLADQGSSERVQVDVTPPGSPSRVFVRIRVFGP